MTKIISSLFFFSIITLQIHSQNLQVPLNIKQAYDKGTRSEDGSPGKNYWQNKAKYSLKVNFDPKKRLVSGMETIIYFNNSPDTLTRLWFKIYPNLYKKNASRQVDIDEEDLSDGVEITNVIINGELINPKDIRDEITNLIVKIKPLYPNQILNVSTTYSYILNKGSHYRTGQVDEGSYFIAYFFPRIAVYDDIDKWNESPYTGSYEFYNDFCDFESEISVPKNYVVWATGDLINSNEVLMPEIVSRIKQAELSDAITDVIDSIQIKKNLITISNKINTWKYEAKNVTDFVFAISNHYVWKSTSLIVDSLTNRRTRVDAVYDPIHKDYFDVIQQARKTVEAMSFVFPKWPFPYQHETVFDGLDQMEYPMMVNDNPLSDHNESIELTDHEIMHTMFPFYMGINETKYGWMDEGWATIGEWLISPLIDPNIIDGYGIDRYEAVAGKEVDIPIMTLTTNLISPATFINSYAKPAMAYLYLKDMLGDDLFYKSFHYYISQWNGKHPMPFDFFNCMNKASEQNLNSFFQRWFFENGYPDLAIQSVNKIESKYQVTIKSNGTRPLPIDIAVIFANSTSLKLHKNVSCWKDGNLITTLEFESLIQPLELILGDPHTPDIDKSNNTYKF